jgi:diadenosine tetraphosphate (Ap4A) HIT family hydrolase
MTLQQPNMKHQNIQLDLDNAREAEQIEEMKKILETGECPFCFDNFQNHTKNQEVIKEGKFWFLVHNRWPYKHTKVHLMAIYKTHAEDLSELDHDSGNELIELMQWSQKQFNVPGGGFSMRFGDTNYSAGTVQHLHVQFIQPDINDPDYQSVRVKIGKSPDKLFKKTVKQPE